MKYPRLNALKAERLRRLKNEAAPYVEAAERANNRAFRAEAKALELAKIIKGAETLVKSEILKHITREMGSRIGDKCEKLVMEAVSEFWRKKIGSDPSGIVTVKFPAEWIAYMDRESAMRKIFEQYKSNEIPKNAGVTLRMDHMDQRAIHIHFSIDEIHMQRIVTEMDMDRAERVGDRISARYEP